MTLEELEARLRKMEDIEEIKKLQARYVYLLDTFQVDKIPDLFADDFTMEMDGQGPFKTKDEVLMIFKGAAKRYSMMCHQTTTPYIEVDGDRAKATWYLFGPFTRETREGPMAIWEESVPYDSQNGFDCPGICEAMLKAKDRPNWSPPFPACAPKSSPVARSVGKPLMLQPTVFQK